MAIISLMVARRRYDFLCPHNFQKKETTHIAFSMKLNVCPRSAIGNCFVDIFCTCIPQLKSRSYPDRISETVMFASFFREIGNWLSFTCFGQGFFTKSLLEFSQSTIARKMVRLMTS